MQEYCNDFVVIPEAETQTIIIAPTIDGAALKLSVWLSFPPPLTAAPTGRLFCSNRLATD